MANEKIRFDLTASDQTAAAFNAILGRLDSVDKSAQKTSASAANVGRAFTTAFAGISIGGLAVQFKQLTDEFTNVTARLSNVTGTTSNFIDVQQKLLSISQENRTAFSQTTDLYSSLARATQSLGVPQEKLLALTDGIGKAFLVSGASGQSAAAALLQLAQGFSAGALRGQEFVSVQEQAPEVLRAVSSGLGVTAGQLKKMAEEGKLTTEVFIDAFLKGMPKVEEQAKRMPTTIGGSLTQVSNSILVTVGAIDKMTGTSSAIASWITTFSKGIDLLVPNIEKLKATSEIAGVASEVLKLDSALKKLQSQPKNAQMFLGIDVEKEIKDTEDKLKQAKDRFNAILQNKEFDKIRTGSRRFFEPEPMAGPVKTKEQEAAEKKLADFLRQQNDELLKLTQGEVALTVEQAKRLGASKKQLTDLTVLENRKLTIKNQDKEIDAISAEFDAIRKGDAKDRLKAEQDLLKLNEKQVEAGDKALNYLEKYREDMDIILEQIQLKNDGVFRTAEQSLIENSRLQLTKKYNEEIVKIKNLDNLTEQGKLNAIAAANLKYQEQFDLVKALAAERIKDRENMMKGATLGVATYLDEIGNFAKFTEDATTRALRGMEDSLVRFVQTGKLSFKDMANSIIADLIRIQLRQSIMGPLAGLIGNAINPGVVSQAQKGSMLSGLSSADIGFEGGGYTGSGARSGGIDGKGGFMAMLHPNETVIDHTKGQGGGVTVVQNINVTTGVQQTVRAEIMTLMPQIAGAAKAAVAEAKMRGGGYAAAMR
jgi:lambda family phage tail tape measure protein